MPNEDSRESARRACLKQVFGGALSPGEKEEVLVFLGTEEGRDYLRQSEEMRRQLKEVAEVRPKSVDAAEMARRFEEMVRKSARATLRLRWFVMPYFGLLVAFFLALSLLRVEEGKWTCRGFFFSAVFAGAACWASWLARMSQERLKDPNLIPTMRRVQEWAKSFPTTAIGWVLGLLLLFGFWVCTYVDVGWNESKPFLWTFIPAMGVSWLAERWILRWTRRRDRELWDWWEGKAGA